MALFAIGVALVMSVASAQPAATAPTAFTPDFAHAVLRDGVRAIAVQSARLRTSEEHLVDGVCIVVEEHRVVARRGGEVVWEAPTGEALMWLGEHAGTAYLTVQAGERQPDTVEKDHVRRLNIATGAWNTPWTLVRGGQPAKIAVNELAADKRGVVVCGELATKLLVEYFNAESDKPLWEAEVGLESIGEERDDQAVLLASTYPHRASAGIRRLTCVEETVVVLPEPRAALRGLARDSGKELWTLDRPWEFQRGFIGPSVWNHMMGRFGIESYAPDVAEVAKKRAEFNRQYQGVVLAGPAVCAASGTFFLIVGRGPVDGWTNYLMEPSVVEVSAYGGPVSIAALPREPMAGLFVERGNDVVWACSGRTIMSLGARLAQPGAFHMGRPGSEDCVTNLAWLRTLDVPHTGPDAWLSAPGIEHAIALGADYAYAAVDGMRIERESEHVVRMPVTRVDLSTLATGTMTLEVPFTGTVAVPTVNCTRRFADGGEESVRSAGPYLMSVTGIQVGGDVLLLTVGLEHKAMVLEFGLGK